ncbi:DEAD/DEAH box helicase [Nakamurella antarctica]|uniref:DEAD/DEAH box helicase n=1 Tax=Nakamurella antarctica TaxID=1902245 RepID=A0A3G8ZML6_9ACTN|nr:DEAD/DEAH box helicase family protein [Nakamurella antarctica]AZI58493.1 DEAD/DEAH box helicase [Nakamurella antarctica]
MPPKRKRTSARRTTAVARNLTTRTVRPSSRKPSIGKTATPAPFAAFGERIWLLEVPFGQAAPGATWVPQWKAHSYAGPALPPALASFASKPFSYQRWLEDELNDVPGPPPRSIVAKEPRRGQYEGADAIIAAAEAGARQFLLADAPGTGKTITLILAAIEIAKSRLAAAPPAKGPTRRPHILVTVDRPAAITVAHWRASIAAVHAGEPVHLGELTNYDAQRPRWLIISPDQLSKLLARNGKPRFRFDVVILDEAQLYRHVDTKRVSAMRRVARFADTHDQAPFVIAATATPSHNPAELTYLGPVFAQIHGEDPSAWDDVGARMAAMGLPLVQRYGKWTWNAEAAQSGALQSESTRVVRRWLTGHTPSLMLHRPAEWGEAPLEPMPVELSAAEQDQYRVDWGVFQKEMGLARVGKSAARGRAAIMRFRQKAGMIRVPYTVDWVLAQVAAGWQVAVSVEFVSTAADPIADALAAQGIAVSRIYGSGRFDAEAERLKFQHGHTQVCVFTVTSSISLHAGEMMADGSRATLTPRIGVLHQPGYSGIAARQRLGRIHRDGQVGEWWMAYAENTIEEQVAGTLMDRLRSTTDIVGGDTSALRSVAALLGADWLPETALTETV